MPFASIPLPFQHQCHPPAMLANWPLSRINSDGLPYSPLHTKNQNQIILNHAVQSRATEMMVEPAEESFTASCNLSVRLSTFAVGSSRKSILLFCSKLSFAYAKSGATFSNLRINTKRQSIDCRNHWPNRESVNNFVVAEVVD